MMVMCAHAATVSFDNSTKLTSPTDIKLRADTVNSSGAITTAKGIVQTGTLLTGSVVDWSLSGIRYANDLSGDVNYTFSNVTSDKSICLYIPANGHVVTFPLASTNWDGGTLPTASASGEDTYIFTYVNGHYHGSFLPAVSSGGGTTIYTGDGTLAGNRVVSSGGHSLKIEGKPFEVTTDKTFTDAFFADIAVQQFDGAASYFDFLVYTNGASYGSEIVGNMDVNNGPGLSLNAFTPNNTARINLGNYAGSGDEGKVGLIGTSEINLVTPLVTMNYPGSVVINTLTNSDLWSGYGLSHDGFDFTLYHTNSNFGHFYGYDGGIGFIYNTDTGGQVAVDGGGFGLDILYLAGTGGIWLNTPNVNTHTAITGQLLALADSSTGRSEFGPIFFTGTTNIGNLATSLVISLGHTMPDTNYVPNVSFIGGALGAAVTPSFSSTTTTEFTLNLTGTGIAGGADVRWSVISNP